VKAAAAFTVNNKSNNTFEGKKVIDDRYNTEFGVFLQ